MPEAAKCFSIPRRRFMNRTKSGMTRVSGSALHRKTAISVAVACACAASGALLVADDASARLTRLQITSRGPAFGGFSLPNVGTYERIVGKYFGELNPNDFHNSLIVDISLAPRNANGNVE